MKLGGITVVAGVALALTACGGGSDEAAGAPAPSSSAPDITVTGRLTVHAGFRNVVLDGSQCAVGGGYNDIHAGTQVVVSDEDGSTVAVGALERGYPTDSTHDAGTCVFPFRVADVPHGPTFYGVSVGNRGTQKLAAADMSASMDLTLG